MVHSMNLSKRLSAVAAMVTKGNIAADIGTDHGYMAIYLVEQGISPSTFAMDINKGPLERAKEHIKEAGLEEKITLIQSDGMKGLEGRKADTAVVAGMGGMLICKILEESPVLSELKELILSPHSDVDKVRSCIMEKGFVITKEQMVEDYGKFYNIIKAEKGKTDKECSDEKCSNEKYSELELLYSRKLFESRDKVFYDYLLKLREKYKNIIELLNENESEVSERNRELQKMLKDCEKAIEKWNE